MEGAWEESLTGFRSPATLTFVSHTGLLSDSGYLGQGQILGPIPVAICPTIVTIMIMWRLRSHI